MRGGDPGVGGARQSRSKAGVDARASDRVDPRRRARAPDRRPTSRDNRSRSADSSTARCFSIRRPAANDDVRVVGDGLAREEIVFCRWCGSSLRAVLDVRANSHGLVDDSWQLDFSDRTRLRPRLSVRRLSATVHRGRFTLDAGKQFIRWGKTDIVTPTDRFAPRDFMTVVTTEFIAVTGVRGTVTARRDTPEGGGCRA